MRPFLVLLLATALLAGCADSGRPADAPQAQDGPAELQPTEAAGGDGRLGFGVPDYNQTTLFQASLEPPQPCITSCPDLSQAFDLTPQVPAEAPVELTVTVSDDCTYAELESDGASFIRYVGTEQGISATLVRGASDTVSLVLGRYALCGDPTAATPVTAEARSVVRSDVVPAFLPVVLRLAPGDRIRAMGEGSADIKDFIVIPPGQSAIHHLDDPSFNVTADMPTGEYVVMVTGGEAMLHGPSVTLRPARFLHQLGDDRAVTSGQDLAWTASVPGIPAFAVLYLATGESGGLTGGTTLSYDSGYTMAIRQAGKDLASDEEDACVLPGLPCRMNGPGGQSTRAIGTGLFPEGMGLGDLEFAVTSDAGQGMHAYELVGYISLA